MIIDAILDRKDGCNYETEDFYNYVMAEESIFEMPRTISSALDYGSNKDVQEALCKYVLDNEYNPKICDYINSVEWVDD